MEPLDRQGVSPGDAVANVEIQIGDVTLQPDCSGALWWKDCRTLIVADLHLEKGTSYARRGVFLPPYDSRATLTRLSNVMSRYQPERVLLLGDSFHDRHGMHGLPEVERAMLVDLQARTEWLWITGNHDPVISTDLGGKVYSELREAGLVFRHEPSAEDVVGEIAGHLHPAARVVRHGQSVRRRCFVEDGHRMVVPAFGAYTGGLNVCDPVYDSVFNSEKSNAERRIWMTGQTSVFGVRPRDLKPDQAVRGANYRAG